MIQVFKPDITEREVEAVSCVLKSGWLGTGPKVQEFEEAFAEYVGAKHAVAVNSGTAALHLALTALGVGPEHTVMVPTLTFISTALAVSLTGARVMFGDIDPEGLYLYASPAYLDKCDGIVYVHFAGYPYKPEDESHHVMVEDCAHAAGARIGGQHVGTFGDLGCFSFHAVKNMTTGDGGMIVTNRTDLVETLRRLRWCGISKDTWSRMGLRGKASIHDRASQYGWYYEVARLGWKYQMNDIAAALGLAQLKRLDRMNAKRRLIAEAYNQAFADVEDIGAPPDHSGHAWHAYIVKVPNRDALGAYLRSKDIATGVHYMPLHLHPLYRDPTVRLPMAEEVWQKLLTLPLYPSMTRADVECVIKHVTEGVKACQSKRR